MREVWARCTCAGTEPRSERRYGGGGGDIREIWGRCGAGYEGDLGEIYLRGHRAEVAEGEREGARLTERHQAVVEPARLVRGKGRGTGTGMGGRRGRVGGAVRVRVRVTVRLGLGLGLGFGLG